jgi:hypothetical protein
MHGCAQRRVKIVIKNYEKMISAVLVSHSQYSSRACKQSESIVQIYIDTR